MIEEEKSSFEQFDVQEELTDRQIFTLIWHSPTRVFKFLTKKEYDTHTILLLVLSGIVEAFLRNIDQESANSLSVPMIFVFCIILGGAFGWIGKFIFSYFILWSGKLLKGKAEVKDLIRVMAYSSIPRITVLLLILIQLLVYGTDIFSGTPYLENAELSSIVIFYGINFLQLILAIWSFVIMVAGIAVAHRFSLLKAFFSVLIPFFVIVLLGFTAALIFYNNYASY